MTRKTYSQVRGEKIKRLEDLRWQWRAFRIMGNEYNLAKWGFSTFDERLEYITQKQAEILEEVENIKWFLRELQGVYMKSLTMGKR